MLFYYIRLRPTETCHENMILNFPQTYLNLDKWHHYCSDHLFWTFQVKILICWIHVKVLLVKFHRTFQGFQHHLSTQILILEIMKMFPSLLEINHRLHIWRGIKKIFQPSTIKCQKLYFIELILLISQCREDLDFITIDSNITKEIILNSNNMVLRWSIQTYVINIVNAVWKRL